MINNQITKISMLISYTKEFRTMCQIAILIIFSNSRKKTSFKSTIMSKIPN